MSRTPDTPTCDVEGCEFTPIYVCECRRCKTETSEIEKFHSCGEPRNHREFVEAKHWRIRGNHVTVQWTPYISPPQAKKFIPAADLFERARATLAGKSRSYVQDARLFARAVLLIEVATKGGLELTLEVEEG